MAGLQFVIDELMDELKAKGMEKTRTLYSRHGMAMERTFGVSVAELKSIAKTIKKATGKTRREEQQALAGELYGTGMMEAP